MFDRGILEALLAARDTGFPIVLATIIKDSGSVPRHAGSRMVVYPDGAIIGTIGGGEMESRVISDALTRIKSGESGILHYDLADPAQGDPGVCGGQVDIFMEPILTDPTVLVIGCGHVGQALVELAHWIGFRVIACDDRADLCNPERTPYADQYLVLPPDEVANKAPIHEQTYIAAVTRGVPFDVQMLPRLLKTPARYIGVIGSRRRWVTAVKSLASQGVKQQELDRIHAPIGLELHAETPREIAISIMAEIIKIQHNGTGKPMKWIGSDEDLEQQASSK
jgi:xanthine dehydrogenase accessory factor